MAKHLHASGICDCCDAPDDELADRLMTPAQLADIVRDTDELGISREGQDALDRLIHMAEVGLVGGQSTAVKCGACGLSMADISGSITGLCPTHGVQPASPDAYAALVARVRQAETALRQIRDYYASGYREGDKAYQAVIIADIVLKEAP